MLYDLLLEFKDKVNNNTKLTKLTKNWNPNIIIKSTDTGDVFTVKLDNSKIIEVSKTLENADHEINLQAEEKELIDIFAGKINPAEAAVNGQLMLFGEQRDQIKLDIIALTIWGA